MERGSKPRLVVDENRILRKAALSKCIEFSILSSCIACIPICMFKVFQYIPPALVISQLKKPARCGHIDSRDSKCIEEV